MEEEKYEFCGCGCPVENAGDLCERCEHILFTIESAIKEKESKCPKASF